MRVTHVAVRRADVYTQIIVHTGEHHQHEAWRHCSLLLCHTNLRSSLGGCCCMCACMRAHHNVCILILLYVYNASFHACTHIWLCVHLLPSQMEIPQPSAPFFFLFLFLPFSVLSSMKQIPIDRSLAHSTLLVISGTMSGGWQKGDPHFKKVSVKLAWNEILWQIRSSVAR